jgi:hypothetical protein
MGSASLRAAIAVNSGTPQLDTPPRAPWPEGALAVAEELHRLLSIRERDWHALKSQRSRRAAEQLASALVQLLSGDDPASPGVTPARERATALVDHSLAWLNAEVRDPGCPSHGR